MLKDEIVIQARELLGQGLSRRQVALRLNVSHGTICAIARGRRRVAAPEPEPAIFTGIGRCPTCGMRVELPCVACRAQRYLERRDQFAQIATSYRLVAAMVKGVRPPRRPEPRRVA